MTTCRACGSVRLEPVFEMEPMPLAAAYAATAEEAKAAPKYPMTWLFCERCGLVNVDPDIPDDVLYEHYQYAASEVPALVRHHAEFAAWLVARHPDIDRLLEIGCNDGVLLRQLPHDWYKLGVDPSDVAQQAVSGSDWVLDPRPFTAEVVRGEKFDVITSSNSFAHFTGIGDALDGVREALAPSGSFYLEVHDLAATLASAQWDTIYHEHKVEWSRDSLARAGAIHGLHLANTWRLPLHGGLIRAQFVKARISYGNSATRPDFAALRASYSVREAPTLPSGSWAYGAAARASVYLNQVDTGVPFIVDGSPRRAGKYIPGTGTPILSPEAFDAANPPAALITAWNHAADIIARHPNYKGEWVTAW